MIGETAVETRTALQQPSLDGYLAFTELEHDDLETICTTLHCPGGTIANPQVGVAGQLLTIPDPGLMIGFVQQ